MDKHEIIAIIKTYAHINYRAQGKVEHVWISDHMYEKMADEILKLSLNLPVSCRYSVSLVYEKEIINGFSTQIDTAIRVLITEAENENEALGKAIKNFEKEMKDYGMKMKVVLPTQNYGS